MRTLGVAAIVAVLCMGCPGGGPGSDGGVDGGALDGGAGGGAGDAGPVNTLPGDLEGAGEAVLVAPNGDLLVVGSVQQPNTDTDLLVARFKPTLVRDSTFGRDGMAALDFDGGVIGGGLISLRNDFGAGLALDGDSIVAVGSARGQSLGGYEFAVARFTNAGVLDTTFNHVGTATISFGGAQNAAQLNNVLVTGDKYVTCGLVTTVNLSTKLVRYNRDGSIDTSFDNPGTNFGGSNELCGTLLQQGTKFVAAGRSFTVARYTETGANDVTFGTNGAFTSSGNLAGVHLRADGKLWLVGHLTESVGGVDTTYIKQALLTADGVLDPSFGTGGILKIPYSLSQVRGSALQGSKLVLYIPSAPARLIRLNADGSLDTSFGTSGSIAVPFTLPLFDAPFDAHRHLTVSGNTAIVTDVNLVKLSETVTKSRLGLFSTPLP